VCEGPSRPHRSITTERRDRNRISREALEHSLLVLTGAVLSLIDRVGKRQTALASSCRFDCPTPIVDKSSRDIAALATAAIAAEKRMSSTVIAASRRHETLVCGLLAAEPQL